ncbi:hypothetical protein L1987_23954 [Smallanthus sonchifolius]|uniref:Uncharacterized protein n=1 Tax=Smallanthus sonchifolius TaxID=185202 RepID=A0ACB9IID4_9ASTR|nr:hypothetical protein L1987_23954 [Smallanthus sonchifolius]
MDHLPRSGSRRHPPPTGKQPSPLLTRCKSENPATSPTITAISSNKSDTFTKSRSISATRTRNYKEPEVNPMTINTTLTSPAAKKKAAQDSGTKILPRKKPTSPSAWALSPGRVAPCPSPAVVQPPTPGGRSRTTGGRISGVLKYFRQKKTTSLEDADVHRFKSLNNRLLQWRFANARAETTMSAFKAMAENKLFNAWLEILAIRNSNMVQRMEVRKLKNQIKLYHIMDSQMFLLEKWSRIEANNFEAVGRVVRKLTVASVNIPMLHDSKGDILTVCDVLDTATMLLASIESMITKLSYQAEKSCYLLTELSIIAKQEHESLAELQTWMTAVALLKVTN